MPYSAVSAQENSSDQVLGSIMNLDFDYGQNLNLNMLMILLDLLSLVRAALEMLADLKALADFAVH